MRIYHGVDGRMLFTYAQLSPGGKEGSEGVGRPRWKAMRTEQTGRRREGERGGKREVKVHHVVNERVTERERERVCQRVSTFPHGSTMPR